MTDAARGVVAGGTPPEGVVQSQRRMAPWLVAACGLYLILLIVLLVIVLYRLWPASLSGTALDGTVEVSLLPGGLITLVVGRETRLLLLAAVSGALGSYVHLASSFVDYVGHRQLYQSWAWWYVLRPFIGMALALVVYFTLQAGVALGTSVEARLNPYGVVAMCSLTGMFTKQATDKLKRIFDEIFVGEKRGDALKQEQEASGSPTSSP